MFGLSVESTNSSHKAKNASARKPACASTSGFMLPDQLPPGQASLTRRVGLPTRHAGNPPRDR
jgi:hypothetical protein